MIEYKYLHGSRAAINSSISCRCSSLVEIPRLVGRTVSRSRSFNLIFAASSVSPFVFATLRQNCKKKTKNIADWHSNNNGSLRLCQIEQFFLQMPWVVAPTPGTARLRPALAYDYCVWNALAAYGVSQVVDNCYDSLRWNLAIAKRRSGQTVYLKSPSLACSCSTLAQVKPVHAGNW